MVEIGKDIEVVNTKKGDRDDGDEKVSGAEERKKGGGVLEMES